MNIASKIKELRELHNLSLQQLADKTDISKSVLWQYENNKSSPTAEMIKRLALFFEVTADYLIFDDKERPGMLKIADRKLVKMFESVQKMAPGDQEYIARTIEMVVKGSVT